MDNLEDEERHGHQQEGSLFPQGDCLQNIDADQDLAPSPEAEVGTYC